MKYCRFALFSLLEAIICMGLSGCSPKAGPEILRYGHLAPRTGTNKNVGLTSQQGIELARGELEKEGRLVVGRNLEIVHADAGNSSETIRAETIRLLAVNRVSALLVSLDGIGAERVTREAQTYNIPILLCGEVPSLPQNENAFVLGARPGTRGIALAHYATATFGAGKVAVLTDTRDAIATDVSTAFLREFRKTGKLAILEREYAKEEERIEKLNLLLKAEPLALMVAGSLADFLTVRAHIRKDKKMIPLIYGGSDLGPLAPGVEDAEGPELILATAYCAEGLSDRGKDFSRRYLEAYQEPPGLAAAFAYDGTRLMIEAMTQAGTTNSMRVRECMSKIDSFEGVTGPISMKERQAKRKVFVLSLMKGKEKVVATEE